MRVNDLYLEITRKCNLRCAHCLRGNAQNKTMERSVITNIFENIDEIDTLTLGGGEPGLAVDVIDIIIEHIHMYNVYVGNVFVVTNGKKLDKKLLKSYCKLLQLCKDNEVSAFTVSQDLYHRDAGGAIYTAQDYHEEYCGYNIEEEDYDNIETYPQLYNVAIEDLFRNHTGKEYIRLFARGRAKDFGEREEPYLDNLKLDSLHNPTVINGQMYINYKGDILGDANMAYLDQKHYTRGNVCDWSDALDQLKKSTMENVVWCKQHCQFSDTCDEIDNIEGIDYDNT